MGLLSEVDLKEVGKVSVSAGDAFKGLYFHVEAMAAGYMRKHGIQEATLYINGSTPCLGKIPGQGCYNQLSFMLERGAKLTVVDKSGKKEFTRTGGVEVPLPTKR